MPIYKLMSEMPYDELTCWLAYFEVRPYEWRDDDRTHKLLQAQGYKGKPGSLFNSLKAIYEMPKNDVNSIKNSAFFSKLLDAKGGDKPSFLMEQ
jgi:hypothetical protein